MPETKVCFVMKTKIDVQETTVTVFSVDEEDYISLTDIARHKSNDPFIVVCNWMRNRNTIEYLGLWETLYNPDFKPIEFDRFRMEAGLNAFLIWKVSIRCLYRRDFLSQKG